MKVYASNSNTFIVTLFAYNPAQITALKNPFMRLCSMFDFNGIYFRIISYRVGSWNCTYSFFDLNLFSPVRRSSVVFGFLMSNWCMNYFDNTFG
jgi:hypothetical protein